MTSSLDQLVPDFAVARLRFVLVSIRDAELPILMGSTLRGAFGYQWRAVACAKTVGERGACLVRKYCSDPETCRYARVFEPISGGGSVPTPYVFRPPTAEMTPSLSRVIGAGRDKIGIGRGEKIFFDVLLVGDAIDEYENVGRAIELMARGGLGSSRSEFRVVQAFAYREDGGADEIYRDADEPYRECPRFTLHKYVRSRMEKIKPGAERGILFHTPVRVRRSGGGDRTHLIRHLVVSDIVEQCLRRAKLLARVYGEPFEHDTRWLLVEAAERLSDAAGLWYHPSSRHTNRQDAKLRLDGVLGELTFPSGPGDPLLPCLVAGELLHVGSNCNLGFGMYEVF